jgi:hypothetical protein
MTADHGSEQGRQRTVAELLQQYGGSTSSSGRRRRRGGQSEAEDTGASPRSAGRAPAESSAEQTWTSFAAIEQEDSYGGSSEWSASGTNIGAERSASGTNIGAERSASGTNIGADAERDRSWSDYGTAGLSGYPSSEGTGSYRSSGDPGSGDPGRGGTGLGDSGRGGTGLDSPSGSVWDSSGDSRWARPGGSEWSRPGSAEWASPGGSEWAGSGSSEWARPGGSERARPGGSEWPRPASANWSGSFSLDSYTAESPPAEPAGAESRALEPYAGSYLDPARDSYPGSSRHGGLGTDHDTDRDGQPEDPTEQMPRYGEQLRPTGLLGHTAGAGPITERMPRTRTPPTDDPAAKPTGTGRTRIGGLGRSVQDSGPSTEISSAAELFDDGHDDEPADTLEPDSGESMPDVPAGLADDAELDEDAEPGEAGSGLRAWVVLVGQGIAGAVSGALLWVGFRYLWLNLPVVALAAAVVATAGLVLVVRTMRGSDDLQTTMLAVLVGLIVTISPAVLLLALH